MSIFSHLSGSRKEADDLPIDETKLERAMNMLASEAENINEEDPRQAALLMRKLTEATGMSLSPAMEEALSRLERGEDLEAIEAEMGDILESEDPFSFSSPSRKGSVSRQNRPPRVDDTLYELT
ncbi:MAG: zinc ribbon domain-containing protein [Syntrophales bacterium]|nr:zinc ribbon domain-containing protein [Syntrophales bacterium]